MVSVTTHLGKIEGRSIIESEGRLMCSCMSPRAAYEPCSHVWLAMRQGKDAHHEGSFAGLLFVPLLETPIHGATLVVQVEVRHEEARHGMRPFYFVREGADNEFLGWMAGNEGRWQMRRVLFEYLRSRYPDAPACKSRTHSHLLLSPSERQNPSLDSKSPSVLAGVAGVLQVGVCWRCLHSDNSDLIPDL